MNDDEQRQRYDQFGEAGIGMGGRGGGGQGFEVRRKAWSFGPVFRFVLKRLCVWIEIDTVGDADKLVYFPDGTTIAVRFSRALPDRV